MKHCSCKNYQTVKNNKKGKEKSARKKMATFEPDSLDKIKIYWNTHTIHEDAMDLLMVPSLSQDTKLSRKSISSSMFSLGVLQNN